MFKLFNAIVKCFFLACQLSPPDGWSSSVRLLPAFLLKTIKHICWPCCLTHHRQYRCWYAVPSCTVTKTKTGYHRIPEDKPRHNLLCGNACRPTSLPCSFSRIARTWVPCFIHFNYGTLAWKHVVISATILKRLHKVACWLLVSEHTCNDWNSSPN